jgi:hypothetical protein
LAADGVPVTVDDFGRGDTIIRCLKSQPAQKLKIDMKAIDAHSSEDDSVRILHSIIDMAHALGKIVIAEGIERPEQLLLLKTLGCDLGQGLLPGKPSTAQEIERSFQGILAESALDGSAAHAASPKLRAVPILAPDLHAAKHRATAAVGTAEVAQQDEELAELRTVPMYLAEDYPTVSSA